MSSLGFVLHLAFSVVDRREFKACDHRQRESGDLDAIAFDRLHGEAGDVRLCFDHDVIRDIFRK